MDDVGAFFFLVERSSSGSRIIKQPGAPELFGVALAVWLPHRENIASAMIFSVKAFSCLQNNAIMQARHPIRSEFV